MQPSSEQMGQQPVVPENNIVPQPDVMDQGQMQYTQPMDQQSMMQPEMAYQQPMPLEQPQIDMTAYAQPDMYQQQAMVQPEMQQYAQVDMTQQYAVDQNQVMINPEMGYQQPLEQPQVDMAVYAQPDMYQQQAMVQPEMQQYAQVDVTQQYTVDQSQMMVQEEVTYQQPIEQPQIDMTGYSQPDMYQQQAMMQPEMMQQYAQADMTQQYTVDQSQMMVQEEVTYQQPIEQPQIDMTGYSQPDMYQQQAMMQPEMMQQYAQPMELPSVQAPSMPVVEQSIEPTIAVKSVLFFMNGFGLEVPGSFNIYTSALMPSLAKLSNYYPFASLFGSGTEVGLNKGQLSNFKPGYTAFSCGGKPNKKSNVVASHINNDTFENNPIIASAINHAVENKSRMHILFPIGERTDAAQFAQLKKFGQLCKANNIDDICVHVFLGDNSVKGLKVSAMWLKNLKFQVTNFVEGMRLVSIAGRKYLDSASKDEKVSYYRMIVSGVGEVWSSYEETLAKKYEGKSDDDNMGGFLTVRENVLRANDSIMFFNYDNSIGAEYTDILQNPKIYFPAGGKIPLNVIVNSLFEVTGNEKVPYAFDSDLPENYFLEKIPNDKKILIIADSDRVEYISKCLNGFRTDFKPNVNVWPIEDKKRRFEMLAQYLGAYINKDYYDLIIADCELFNTSIDENSIAGLRKNMSLMDKCLNIAYTKSIEKGYTLYLTSLYGLKTRMLLTKTYEVIDLSQKVPFIIAGKDITRSSLSIPIDGNFTQVAQVIQANMGVPVKSTLVHSKIESQGKKNKVIIVIGGIILFAFIGFLIFVYLFTQGYI